MSHTFIPTTTADEPDDVTNEQWVDDLRQWLRTARVPYAERRPSSRPCCSGTHRRGCSGA